MVVRDSVDASEIDGDSPSRPIESVVVTITVEGMIAEDIPNRDPVDATKSLDIDGDCPSRLVDSGFVMRVGECSVVISSISVDVGSNEAASDLVTVKVDSMALDSSVVTCFTSVVVGVKPVMDGRTVAD